MDAGGAEEWAGSTTGCIGIREKNMETTIMGYIGTTVDISDEGGSSLWSRVQTIPEGSIPEGSPSGPATRMPEWI